MQTPRVSFCLSLSHFLQWFLSEGKQLHTTSCIPALTIDGQWFPSYGEFTVYKLAGMRVCGWFLQQLLRNIKLFDLFSIVQRKIKIKCNEQPVSKGNERAVTMNNGIYLHILPVGSLKPFFFFKQTTKWSYFWAVKNDRKGVRPDLNSKRLSRHAQSCSICLIFFSAENSFLLLWNQTLGMKLPP